MESEPYTNLEIKIINKRLPNPILIGINGEMFFFTNYNNNNKQKIFNPDDIEEKTSFSSNFIDDLNIIHNITCRFFSPSNENIRIFCFVNENGEDFGKYIKSFYNCSFIYENNYKINIFSEDLNIQILKADYHFPFIYSDIQILYTNISNTEQKSSLRLKFDTYIAELSAKGYLEVLVKNLHPRYIVTGFNHTFGFNKEGNSDLLKMCEKKYNYNYKCVLPSMYEDEIVSSSLIKELLKKGNIGRANLLLKNRFSLEGEVIHGAEIGRTIGFPTANINYPSGIVSVPYGVYAVFVELPNGDKHRAIMNWGMKPTVNNTKEPVAEIHILDYMGDLYGKIINVELIERIRGEEKFSDLDELRAQITKDIEACLKL